MCHAVMLATQVRLTLAAMTPQLEAMPESFAEYVSAQSQNAASMSWLETKTVVAEEAV